LNQHNAQYKEQAIMIDEQEGLKHISIQDPLINRREPHDNNSYGVTAQSMAFRIQTADDFLKLQDLYNKLIAFCLPFAIAIIVMSTMWADILAKRDQYMNVDLQWQACLTSADYQYIDIQSQINKATSNFQDCIHGLYDSGTCDLQCVASIKLQCGSSSDHTTLNDIALPSGHYLSGLSYIGIQTVIFASVAHVAMRRALHHPSWLISTIALVFWFCFAIFTYYAVSPILPMPSQTNSTLFSYMYTESNYGKYENLGEHSHSNCDKAYLYVWIYMGLILVLASTVLAGGCIGVYAERIRYKSNHRKHYVPLKHTEIPLIIGVLAIASYLILVACKLTASVTSMDAIYDIKNGQGQGQEKALYFYQNYFPFLQPSLDISTLLGVASFMSVLRGYTIQSVSAFRMAFATALVFSVSTYPSIIGGFEFYYHNHFEDSNSCQAFFLKSGKYTSVGLYETPCVHYFISDQAFAFGYPSELQAKFYCSSFRVALAASTALFALLHFLTVACYFMFTQNQDRDSLIHEPINFEAALERAGRRSSSSAFAIIQ
jgi:hypothetical protein